MLEIFRFYLNLVVQLFNNVLNGFEVANGIGFGTFLLACSLFVVFINLLKFQFGTNGFEEIKTFRSKQNLNNAKHREYGIHEKGQYIGYHSREKIRRVR